MKISVIVTVYNRFEYARNILKCLMVQTHPIYELIFADDGSKENLSDAIKDLIPKCDFKVKHAYQEDLGFRLARSRNNAVRIADGDYLMFLDQDVIFPTDFIEKIVLNARQGRLVYCKPIMSDHLQKTKFQNILDTEENYNTLYKSVRNEQKKLKKEVYKKDRLYNFLYSLKLRSRGAKLSGMFFSIYRNDFIKINGFDEKYQGWGYEDDDFCNRLFRAGIKTYPLDFERYPIHMYHPFDPTKTESPNEQYYRARKKEVSEINYECEFGYNNILGNDRLKIKILK